MSRDTLVFKARGADAQSCDVTVLLGVDFWDTARWEQEFEATDCVVMTAQIWLAVLTHAYWTLDRVGAPALSSCLSNADIMLLPSSRSL